LAVYKCAASQQPTIADGANEEGDEKQESAGKVRATNWRTRVFARKLWKSSNSIQRVRSEGAVAEAENEGCASEARKKEKKPKKEKKSKKKSENENEDGDYDAEGSAQVSDPEVPIHALIKRGDIEEIKRQISKRTKREKGYFLRHGPCGRLLMLVSPRSDDDVVNAKNSVGSTPLHVAVEVPNLEVILVIFFMHIPCCVYSMVQVQVLQLLLKNGADPDIADGIGWTPLLAACKYQLINSPGSPGMC
jgi:hypothetical protein